MITSEHGPTKNHRFRKKRTAIEKEQFCNNTKYLSKEGTGEHIMDQI